MFQTLGFRVFLVALLPALTALFLGGIVTLGRLQDLHVSMNTQALTMAQQLAANAEFALFADDLVQIRALVAATQTTPRSVRVAALYDRHRQLLTYGGAGDHLDRQLPATPPTGDDEALRHIVAVRGRPLLASSGDGGPVADGANLLGWALVELDSALEYAARRRILQQGLAITIVTLLIGALLSWRLLLSITRPLSDIMGTVGRLQAGALDARADTAASAGLGQLAAGINSMASAMENNQLSLRAQVTHATAHLHQTIQELEDKNRALDATRAQALAAGEAKADFLARMSHEIRTPVNAILGYARLLDAPEASGARPDHLRLQHVERLHVEPIAEPIQDA